MRRWHIPSRTGDFELTAHPKDPNKSLLVTENLTPDEVIKVGKFLRECRNANRKWIDDLVGVTASGRCEIEVEASVEKAGALFVVTSTPSRGRLTAIRSKDGHMVEVTSHDDAAGPGATEAAKTEAETTALATAAAKPTTAVAATVKPPTRCCPVPVEGPLVRSSRVLKSFCTEEQWGDWVGKGYLHCYGSHTGHKYRIAHRHHPVAAVQQKCVFDLDMNYFIKCWDWSIPPAEEVLAMKLYLEHREPMIRNRSTVLGSDPMRFASIESRLSLGVPLPGFLGDGEDVFEDYTGGADGTWDAGYLGNIGRVVEEMTGLTSEETRMFDDLVDEWPYSPSHKSSGFVDEWVA